MNTRKVAEEILLGSRLDGGEYATPSAISKVFKKSVESVHKRGAEGKLGPRLRIRLGAGHPVYCYTIAGCKEYWTGTFNTRALVKLQREALPLIVPCDEFGYSFRPVSVLHSKRIIELDKR